MLIDDGVLSSGAADGPSAAELTAIAVPPTIQALIAARLGPARRRASARSSRPRRSRARSSPASGVRGAGGRRRARPGRRRTCTRSSARTSSGRVGASEDTFRFRHQLIRDGGLRGDAQGAARRSARALREPAGRGLRRRVPVADELLGYHLERAVLLRRELGEAEAATAELAARASTSLRAAGRRAMLRDDPASVRLLERALALIPGNDRAPVLVELANALDEVGDLDGCAATATAALELACANGDRRTAARARVVELRVTMDRSTGEADLVVARMRRRSRSSTSSRPSATTRGMAAVLLLLGHINQDRFEQSSGYLERALVAAERAGDRQTCRVRGRVRWAPSRSSAPCPPAKGSSVAAPCADGSPTTPARRPSCSVTKRCCTRCRAASTRHAALHAEAVRAIDDLGNPWLSASTVFGQWLLELLAGAPERAEAVGPREPRAPSRRWAPPTRARPPPRCWPSRSSSRAATRRPSRYADLAAAWAAPDDIASQVPQLAARAHVLAARGELERAEAAAREAVRLSERSDDICQRGDALVDLAAVLDRAGRVSDAAAALRAAIAPLPAQGQRGLRRPRPHKSGATGTRGSNHRRVAVVGSFTRLPQLASPTQWRPQRLLLFNEGSSRSAPRRPAAH